MVGNRYILSLAGLLMAVVSAAQSWAILPTPPARIEPLTVRLQEPPARTNCAESLISEVVRRRFTGKTARVYQISPEILEDPMGTLELLGSAGVDDDFANRIVQLLTLILNSGADEDPLLHSPLQVLRFDTARRGLILCLVGGDCQGRHDGLYVSAQKTFETTSLRYPEFSDVENRDYRIDLSHPHAEYPPLLVASVHGLGPTTDAVVLETRALKWLGMLFHELKHHANRQLTDEWIEANLWFRDHGIGVDRLFSEYVETSGRVPKVDRGFLTVFEESTAHNVAFRVIALALSVSGHSIRQASAIVQANHAKHKVDEILSGKYGPSAVRTMREGLDLADHMGEITDQNFLLVGSSIHQQMMASVEKYRRLRERTLPPVPLPTTVNPTYSITDTTSEMSDKPRP